MSSGWVESDGAGSTCEWKGAECGPGQRRKRKPFSAGKCVNLPVSETEQKQKATNNSCQTREQMELRRRGSIKWAKQKSKVTRTEEACTKIGRGE